MHRDDRKEFDARRMEKASALAQDRDLLARGVKLYRALDAYDYPYLWTFLGVPIIQTPADIVALQEVIWHARPDVIIETGVARGGSAIFLAAMCRLLGKGKVIGVDIDIRAHNRETIESHPFADAITLIEGDSIAPATLSAIRAEIPGNAKVIVILDSDHRKDHVLQELRAYAPLVSPGGYLVVSNTILGLTEEADAPRNRANMILRGDDPLAAIAEFLREDGSFERDDPINGKLILANSPGGYLRKSLTSGGRTSRIATLTS